MVEGVKDYRGQRHIMSLCAMPAQSPLNVAAVPHGVLGDFGLLLGGETEPGFRAGCGVVGCHSCIHIHRAESCSPAP